MWKYLFHNPITFPLSPFCFSAIWKHATVHVSLIPQIWCCLPSHWVTTTVYNTYLPRHIFWFRSVTSYNYSSYYSHWNLFVFYDVMSWRSQMVLVVLLSVVQSLLMDLPLLSYTVLWGIIKGLPKYLDSQIHY